MDTRTAASVSRCFCAPTLTAAILLSATLAHSQSGTVQPADRPDSWWTERHAEKAALAQKGGIDLVFVGDSITHAWESEGKAVWEEYYADRNALNLGFSGDQTQQVLWRFANGELDGISPKLAVVMIGTNNLGVNTAEEIAEGVRAVVAALRTELPTTKVLALAIFPRGDAAADVEKLRQANALIEGSDFDEAVHFFDVGPWLRDADGTVPVSLLPDGVHPNAVGYQLWAEAIEPKVAELMGESEPKGWTPLFNGKDLSGWEQVGSESWQVEDGVLYTVGGEGGWLSTAREYGDVDLELEYRVPEGGNSGIFLHAPREGNPAFDGIEVQLIDDYTDAYGELQPWQLTGSVYAVAAPTRQAALPAGNWQKIRVRAVGPRVTVLLNDVPIVDVDRSKAKSHSEQHPGLLRASGYIGLQNHGSRFDFRNIRIRELGSQAAPAPQQ